MTTKIRALFFFSMLTTQKLIDVIYRESKGIYKFWGRQKADNEPDKNLTSLKAGSVLVSEHSIRIRDLLPTHQDLSLYPPGSAHEDADGTYEHCQRRCQAWMQFAWW